MAPLVSLVVRSVGRPELAEALAAIAAQDYEAIEAIVVAASGPAHPAQPNRRGPFVLRFIAGAEPRPRAVAANAGLDAAAGVFVGLLDDDDLIEPTHVSGLVRTLAVHPQAIAAYASAREVDESGATIARRTQAFSHFLLFQDCYLAPNAVLFRREALARARFDAAFEVCEDWDFWLQLAEQGEFVHVPAETAVMRATLGQSGTGRGDNRDRARYEHFRTLLAAKWTARGNALAAALDAEVAAAHALLSAQRVADASVAADRVLARYPFHAGALNLKGTAVALQGDPAGAVRWFRAALAEDGEDIGLRLNLAQALDRSGARREALAEYRRVLERSPGHEQALARVRHLEFRNDTTTS